MTDTPQHIKDLQLQIWLAKPPMERLRQFLVDNEALYLFWKSNKPDEVSADRSSEKPSSTKPVGP